MNVNIRQYKNEDYEMIKSWHIISTGETPMDGLMIENGTFILERANIPALCLTVLLTQSNQVSYCFGYIKNPLFKEQNLENEGRALWEHCFSFAKEKGYNNILCFSNVDKLKDKYQRFGMRKTMDNLSSFVRNL